MPRPLAIFLVVTAIALTMLLANHAALDTALWRGTRWAMGDQDAYVWAEYRDAHPTAQTPWYKTGRPPLRATLYKKTEKFWRLFRDLGEPQLAVILFFVIWVYDRRKLKAAAIFVTATSLAGILSSLLRMAGGRLRPDGVLLDGFGRPVLDAAGRFVRNEGANHWYFLRGFGNLGKASDLSFPSGHATLAFAVAAVLAYLSPRGRYLFFTLAALCATARVVMQAHFYSDALAGAALGAAVGYLTARTLDQKVRRPELARL